MTTRTRIIGGGAVGALLVVALVGGWYLFIRDDAPAAVNLVDAVAAATGGETPEASVDATEEPWQSGTAAPSSPDVGEVGLVGDWALVAGADSFVGYRVQEELARIGAATAVGRTSDLSASLSFDGTAITAVEVEANLAALRSYDNRRDRTLGRQALETNAFPTATFSLTEPVVLDVEPVEGVPIVVTAVGDLTLHGVTRRVTVDLEGQLVANRVVVVGSTPILFSDYDIDPPSAVIVLAVEDNGVMEFQLVLERV